MKKPNVCHIKHGIETFFQRQIKNNPEVENAICFYEYKNCFAFK